MTGSGMEAAPMMTVPAMELMGVRVTAVPALCHDLPQRSLVDGLLGLSFYVIWHRQLKNIAIPSTGEPSSLEPDLREGERREAKSDKPISPDDIQKIIDEGSS